MDQILSNLHRFLPEKVQNNHNMLSLWGQGQSKLKWPWKALVCCWTPKIPKVLISSLFGGPQGTIILWGYETKVKVAADSNGLRKHLSDSWFFLPNFVKTLQIYIRACSKRPLHFKSMRSKVMEYHWLFYLKFCKLSWKVCWKNVLKSDHCL